MFLTKIDPTGEIHSPTFIRINVASEVAKHVQLFDAVTFSPTGELTLAKGKLEPVVGVVQEIEHRIHHNLRDRITLVTVKITDPPTCLAIKRGDISKLRVPVPPKSRFQLVMEETYGVSPE